MDVIKLAGQRPRSWGWDRTKALQKKAAWTRDGRIVTQLREATLDGRTVLIGVITTTKGPWKHGTILQIESAYWERGGLGLHGGDDLVTETV